ncbi:MAG TPA: hypothetical protein VH186_13760 [Chloroflexia bacterium]|nr:hypothetical protein [Chloroflexia bacterium]
MFLLAYLLIQGGLVVRKIMKEGKVVAGTVLNSTVEVSTGGRTSSYLLRIEYEFIVPGEIYRLNGTYTKSYPILLKKPDPVEPGTPVAVVFLTNSKYTLL